MKTGPNRKPSTQPAHSVDWKAFALFVHARRAIVRNISMHEAAGEAGVSSGAVHRCEHGLTLSAETFLALARWIEANPFWFLVDPRTGLPVADPPASPVSRTVPRDVSRGTDAVTGAAR